MKKREPVSHIMTKHVLAVQQTDTLREAVNAIRSHKIRHLPVLNGNAVSGILSSADINRLTFGSLFDNQEGANEAILDMLDITQVMSKNPKTVTSETSIRDVAEIFTKEDFHALPVVDGDELKGIVTTTDVLAYMVEQY